MRVAEFIAQNLAERGAGHIFSVTGGGAMFLNDAFGFHPDITPIYNHHEQASAMAAEAYARISGKIGVVVATTGPGSINTLNGVFGAWTDSIPMLILSGQVKRETCMSSYDLPGLRQLGDQEVDIISMVRPITKYAAQVRKPEDIRHELEKALYLASHGRPGPCWLDIPLDVQSATVEPEHLRVFSPPAATVIPAPDEIQGHAKQILEQLGKARRPVLMAGTGVRLAGAEAVFLRVARMLGIPVVTAWTHDLIASADPLFCGRPGTIGTRAGNFTVQSADLVLILGSRMNIRQTSYNWSAFAPKAMKIQVDIDPAELGKPTFRPDHGICCDLKPLLETLEQLIPTSGIEPSRFSAWLSWCKERLERFPGVSARQRIVGDRINPYHFVDTLFQQLDERDIIACGNATACIVPFQIGTLKAGQRMFSNSGSASMGYDLPAAIGAWFGALAARGNQARVVCLAGDGSLQMNIQELQTFVNYAIPIKLFVLNNRGYLSIRSSQQNFFGRLTGEGPDSGVTFPDFAKVGAAYGLPATVLRGPGFADDLKEGLNASGPMIFDVMLDESQGFEPRMSSRQLEDGRIVSAPLEDMYPFLDREILAGNMIDSTAHQDDSLRDNE
ncbi:MAG: thiamine pyrophosphate-binding protein [Proteobacteria bacterium]|nr:thiamine pyrophosphate-binding protein [Pseudomonadota bacterium]HQR03999.1 thiamine pyrophosphate-binding protein [Rhodocyclaceae bacterium]